MRLKQFINESRGKALSLDDTKKLLQTKCKKAVKAYKKGSIIYRGVNENNEFIYVSPSKFTRVSANTDNYYTLINDNSPAWAKYPKRSKSIICTTDDIIAEQYGVLYTVFPFDGAKIGVCSSYDYWFSFPFLKKVTEVNDMDVFNSKLYYMFAPNDFFRNIINDNIKSDISKVKTYEDLRKIFKEFDIYIKKSDEEIKKETGINHKKSPTIEMIIEKYQFASILKGYDKFMNLERYIQYLLDPKKNKFQLKTIGDKLPPKREVWTDADSVLIKTGIENKILS